MSFNNSAGVYPRVVDQSFSVSQSGIIAGGIVITAKRGKVGLNTVTSLTEFRKQYGVANRDNPSMYAAERYLSRASILTVRRVIADAVAASGELLVGLEPQLTVTAENEGVWGNTISIQFEDLSETEGAGVFRLFVYENGLEVERFTCSRDTDAKDGYGSALFIEDVINGQSKYIRVSDDPSVAGDYLYTSTITLSGGADDTIPVASGDLVLAWDEFSNRDEVTTTLLINGGFTAVEVQQKMLAVAETRKDAFAILDVPEADSTDVSAMVTFRKTTLGADTYWGGLYGGWVRVYDAVNDIEVTIPASGDVAAVFNYTVEVGERWDAPAGVQRGIIRNAIGVSKVFTEGERDLLYVAGINPVTSINGTPAVVYGQKTLQKASSALDRVGTVNLVTWAGVKMTEALQPFVFQNNTEQTRNAANFLLSSFWENIKQRQGVYDFYVDTSATLNTPAVIDANQLLINLYIKPVRAAEFIRLSTIVTATGVELG